MNQTIAEKWITALESGKYQQGQNFLRNNEEFCVFGVYCDVVDSQNWVRMADGIYLHDYYQHAPSPEVISIGEFSHPEQSIERISTMNDEYAFTFKTIAEYIRMNWKYM